MRIQLIAVLTLTLISLTQTQQGFQQTDSDIDQSSMMPRYDDANSQMPTTNYNPQSQGFVSPTQNSVPIYQDYNPPNQNYKRENPSFAPPTQNYQTEITKETIRPTKKRRTAKKDKRTAKLKNVGSFQTQENPLQSDNNNMSLNQNPIPPNPTYSPPNPNYAPSNSNYGPPNRNYPSSHPNYASPNINNMPPIQNYMQQNQNYGNSAKDYIQPNLAAFDPLTNDPQPPPSHLRPNKQTPRTRRMSSNSKPQPPLQNPSRQTYLNTSFADYAPPMGKVYNPDPVNPDLYTQQAVTESAGPVDYYPNPDFFNRFENWQGFNSWFKNLWSSGRFTHEYRYDLIDTNFFVGQPETVGNPIYSDQESVDLQNYEQHFAHLQKILGDERTDQDFVIAYSKERASHERMLRFREMRDTVFQSILQMEQVIYAEQDQIISDLRVRNEMFENETIANISAALFNLTGKPYFPKFADPLDIFVS